MVVGLITVDNLPFVEGLKHEIAAAGLAERIRFLGELPVEEVPLWYKRISIYVFASRVEGFGLTMLEAMAAGDAVVAARAGAAEMIITDGADGVLTPVDNVEALVAALEPLMREPQRIEPMGARARARVVSAFSRDREADEISGGLPAGVGGAKGLEWPRRQSYGEVDGAGSIENEEAQSDQNEGQNDVPVTAQRLAQYRMPDQPPRREAPKNRQGAEDRYCRGIS